MGKIFSFRIILQALPTIVFTAITISALISDYALASLLSLLLKHGQFGISFEGMEQGINLGDLFGEVETGKRTIVLESDHKHASGKRTEPDNISGKQFGTAIKFY